jgi:2-iminobutanoate/2-iminopropanoate deaminase
MKKGNLLFLTALVVSQLVVRPALAEKSKEDKPLSTKKEIIRIEPYSTYIEKFAPVSLVVKHGDTLYISGMPPYDKKTGEIVSAPIKEQTEIVCEQLVEILKGAGSSPENALKCNVYCTNVDYFPIVNEVYKRYFPNNPPARVFMNIPKWAGHFDIEIDCVAAIN